MVSIDSVVVVPILVLCSIVFILIVALLIYGLCCRHLRKPRVNYLMYSGFRRTKELELSCDPVSGAYGAPLEVAISVLSGKISDILVDVRRLPDGHTLLAGGTWETVRLLGNDEHYGDEFLLYTKPLEFMKPGCYTVRAHTVDPSLRTVGCVHQFFYNVFDSRQPSARVIEPPPFSPLPQHGGQRGVTGAATAEGDLPTRPLPPQIIPEHGEVTVLTPVMIAPHENSTTSDQIRYSVDGSHPSLLYTGPFTLSIPPHTADDIGAKSRRAKVVVRAIAVSAHDYGMTSEVAEALLTVYEAGHSFYDPTVPVPVARVHALEAELFFDESQRPPNTSISYQLVYISEARKKPKFSRKKGVIYDGKPVLLKEDVAFVYAWTFLDTSHKGNGEFSPIAHDNGVHHHVRSSAAVYDCTRALLWNREGRGGDAAETFHKLPAPFICIRCKEMEVYFEEPPVGGIICYTLDSTEPAQPNSIVTKSQLTEIGFGNTVQLAGGTQRISHLGTHIYKSGQPICVTLLKTDQVFLTARIFIPIVSQATSGDALTGYRYGDRFNRGFTTQ